MTTSASHTTPADPCRSDRYDAESYLHRMPAPIAFAESATGTASRHVHVLSRRIDGRLASGEYPRRGRLMETTARKETDVSGAAEKAILAGGCFWGVQDLFRRRPGVRSTRVGYTGGDVPGPFWEAEPEHQDYLERYPNGYTCHFVRPDWVLPQRTKAAAG